ncbi:MAG: hypothetical protein RXR20_04810 [Paraburkholderia sp.]|jgi:hypothetical protein|uniref:hypothetical protein n=1 Tax=Burkholderiaceae TaxID=119060 RepID=UPI0010F5A70F|nr:hypothetical protein [Burkholderia sp. 4M9327F10]
MKTTFLAAAVLLAAVTAANAAHASTNAAPAPRPPAAKAPVHVGPWKPYPAEYMHVKVKHSSK